MSTEGVIHCGDGTQIRIGGATSRYDKKANKMRLEKSEKSNWILLTECSFSDAAGLCLSTARHLRYHEHEVVALLSKLHEVYLDKIIQATAQ